MTPKQQKLHNALGNVIGTAKRKMLDRLKEGAELNDMTAQFVGEVRLGFQKIEAEQNLNPESVSESN